MTALDERAVTETERERSQWLADARAILDLIEANPALPVPYMGLTVMRHAEGTDEQARAEVNAAADALGVTPTMSPYGHHYAAKVEIGRASYEVVSVPSETMRRHSEVQRLGKAALEQQEVGATS